ncbi:hypothetical protein [Rhizobium aegyptiacum]|uniref:hypothetical protein n=1 Tax=Rhizobium aegyptiacum TaxID=1764550 RepID=UPI0007E537CF|nr:hypothetical protein [Rhizobium aegyptiacum]
MSHNVVAVVGSPAAVSAIVDAAGCPEPTTLPFGLAIAPLGDQQIDRLTELQPGPSHQGFKSLSAALAQAFATASENGQLAYIETAYFGGTGSQAAAAFAEGRMLFSAVTPVRRNPFAQAIRSIRPCACSGWTRPATPMSSTPWGFTVSAAWKTWALRQTTTS